MGKSRVGKIEDEGKGLFLGSRARFRGTYILASREISSPKSGDQGLVDTSAGCGKRIPGIRPALHT